jgi:hypothetical protein
MFGKGKKEKAAELFQTGSKAVGTVMLVQDTGMTINDNPRIKMTFRVEPIDGSPAFDAHKTKTVSRLQIPRQGERYPVWYDRNDPETWAFAMIADDTGRATMRQMFGAAAEQFVGMGGAPVATAPAAAPAAAAPAVDPVERLQKLGELRAQGVIYDAQFEEQKAKLLQAL